MRARLVGNHRSKNIGSDENRRIAATITRRHKLRINQQWRLALLALGTWLYHLLFSTITLTGENRTITAPDHQQQTAVLRYECPTQHGKPENVVQALKEYKDWYESVSRDIVSSSFVNYFQAFRNITYDRWGKNYEELKAGMWNWKRENFADLKSGDSIYESACGIGLNLFMTLEILHETLGLTDLVVYGNDYVSSSAQIARNLAFGTPDHPQSFLPGRGRYGTICPGDSAHLNRFVPANSFDLVYTGYLSPLFNPLGLNGSSVNENMARHKEYCAGKTEEDVVLARTAQHEQDNWYAAWVSEMVRIAKPGRPILVESVSPSLCVCPFDWGGVEPSFWNDSIRTHRWDVDPDSLRIRQDSIFSQRYNVFLRKNA